MAKANILHVLMGDYRTDSRVRNETETLQNEGYACTVYCLTGKGLPKHEVRNDVVIRRFGLSGPRLWALFTGFLGMALHSFSTNYKVVHAHEIMSLPIGWFIATIKRCPYIYDAHELWSKSHHKKENKFLIGFAESVEVFFAKRARTTITVSESIAKYLTSYFKTTSIHVVRNIPSYVHEGRYDLLREAYPTIAKTDMIFIYQGLISKARGTHIIAEALRYLKDVEGWAFVFMGSGPYESTLKSLIPKSMSHRVFFHGQISQDVLLSYTASADVGVHPIMNTCLNHQYCLPNKLFEYLQAGISVLTTGLTDMKQFIEDHGIGDTFSDGDSRELSEKMIALIQHPDKVVQYKAHAEKARQHVTWENESKTLLNIYHALLKA